MKTSSKAVLLVVATLGVAGAAVHMFLPGGLPAAIEKAFASGAAKPRPASAPRADERPAAQPSGASELQQAERDYDAGDFAAAIDGFLAARADADPDWRERAERGLRKAVLAWALTAGAAPPASMPADVDAEIARRQKDVEAAPSEHAWYDLTMFAAGCGAARKLPFLAQQAVSSALRDGPVETRLRKILERAGSRTNVLKEAMTTEGFLDREPVDPVAAASAPRPDSATGKPAAAASRIPISVPIGAFSPATKAKLEQAVDLEKKGAIEFDLCGPDEPKRKEHRKAAVELLKQARDIYQAAQEEDPDCSPLGRRLQVVMEMISHLHKEMSLGE